MATRFSILSAYLLLAACATPSTETASPIPVLAPPARFAPPADDTAFQRAEALYQEYDHGHEVWSRVYPAMRPLAESGDPRAMYYLGMLYLVAHDWSYTYMMGKPENCAGMPRAQCADAALEWLRKSATDGNGIAQDMLVQLLIEKTRIPALKTQDTFEEAFHWARLAARQREPYSAFILMRVGMEINFRYVDPLEVRMWAYLMRDREFKRGRGRERDWMERTSRIVTPAQDEEARRRAEAFRFDPD